MALPKHDGTLLYYAHAMSHLALPLLHLAEQYFANTQLRYTLPEHYGTLPYSARTLLCTTCAM